VKKEKTEKYKIYKHLNEYKVKVIPY